MDNNTATPQPKITRSSLPRSPPFKTLQPKKHSTMETLFGEIHDGTVIASSWGTGSGSHNSTGNNIFQYEDGTKARPYTVLVSLSHPERNQEFDIGKVSRLEKMDASTVQFTSV